MLYSIKYCIKDMWYELPVNLSNSMKLLNGGVIYENNAIFINDFHYPPPPPGIKSRTTYKKPNLAKTNEFLKCNF